MSKGKFVVGRGRDAPTEAVKGVAFGSADLEHGQGHAAAGKDKRFFFKDGSTHVGRK